MLGATALHDGQPFPKKNISNTLPEKSDNFTSVPSEDCKVKSGALLPTLIGSPELMMFEHALTANIAMIDKFNIIGFFIIYTHFNNKIVN